MMGLGVSLRSLVGEVALLAHALAFLAAWAFGRMAQRLSGRGRGAGGAGCGASRGTSVACGGARRPPPGLMEAVEVRHSYLKIGVSGDGCLEFSDGLSWRHG